MRKEIKAIVLSQEEIKKLTIGQAMKKYELEPYVKSRAG